MCKKYAHYNFMKRKQKIITIVIMQLLIVFCILSFNACYYDNEEELYPVDLTNCDTTNVAYKKTILPYLHLQCLNCHSTTTAPIYGNNINLEGYSNVKKYVDNGSFFGSILWNASYKPMPMDLKTDDCTILKIKVWIDNG